MLTLLALATSFLITWIVIPPLINVARQKNIYDEPGPRKLHTGRVPLLGGVAIFAGTLIAFLFLASRYFEARHLFIVVSLLVLFFSGFIDDLRPLKPASKLFIQIVAVFITVYFADIRIRGMHGLFGMYMLDPMPSVVLSMLFGLVVINAFNFIDGVDGLAAGIAILAAAVFGFLFLQMNENLPALLSFSLCGALGAFLIFNAHPARIFMGDTGSMTTGFILALLAVQLTELSRGVEESGWFSYRSAPVIALSVLILPLVDFIRVTFIRIAKGRSPFHADQNHIHHTLIRLGLSHSQVTVLLLLVNVIFIVFTYVLRSVNPSYLFFGGLVSGLMLSQVPYFIERMQRTRTSRS